MDPGIRAPKARARCRRDFTASWVISPLRHPDDGQALQVAQRQRALQCVAVPGTSFQIANGRQQSHVARVSFPNPVMVGTSRDPHISQELGDTAKIRRG